MKKCITLFALMAVLLSACIGSNDSHLYESFSNDDIPLLVLMNEDSTYCQRSRDISRKKCGASAYLQRKMLLANIADFFWNCNKKISDSCLSIIEVLFLWEQDEYDIYCINQIPPCLLEQEGYTEVSICAEYIVAFKIKGDLAMTEEAIQHAGVEARCEKIHVNELSWYAAIKIDGFEHYVIANVPPHGGGILELNNVISAQKRQS